MTSITCSWLHRVGIFVRNLFRYDLVTPGQFLVSVFFARRDILVCKSGVQGYLYCLHMNYRSLAFLFICAGVVPASFAALKSGGNSSEIDYNRDIRPILSEHCFACHGPDSAARKASLRLDRFDDAIAPRKDNKHAVVPGKPDESEAIRRIFTTDEDDLMPPKKARK